VGIVPVTSENVPVKANGIPVELIEPVGGPVIAALGAVFGADTLLKKFTEEGE
jgi:hypothetical protein